ncbi:Mss1p [Ascoidea rubescens DSM 1968]|uniref:Mitochondrial protein, forms a heterodimer complex with Mto1p n=1 Tax=Ascoidea rubescens DSM 1968 TaxID=1344418 RepID=A0A1D2VKE5_9ASCO|nr:mitochondrial protein, forms a heterodimer complex with Mto1p [Ascoidea rubescens DSM 1968]ODV62082.1 mitochondrial protein, forms a heterodimer complex with Mto1p [Ascoidea rubescens DSM 1968]
MFKNTTINRKITLLSTISKRFFSIPTIFALSTKQGKSAIGIIRISGPESSYILQELTLNKYSLPKPRVAVIQKIYSPKTKSIIDEAVVISFKGPKSFTGEDLIELHLHGGISIINAVLSSIKSLNNNKNKNIRYAVNGEFSKRAFMNGKFDLTEIEGIRDIIEAETESQRIAAMNSMKGDNKRVFNQWRTNILNNIAKLTALLDFGEDYLSEETDKILNQVNDNIQKTKHEIEEYLRRGERSEILLKGFKLTLLGPPNVGKSSLLNQLANNEVAIVSDIAGTTRDIVNVPLDIGGYKVVLGDTAGIRSLNNTKDIVEHEGIKRAKFNALNSDLTLLILSTDEFEKELRDEQIIEQIRELKNKDKKMLIILNKIDLVKDKKKLEDIIEKIALSLNITKEALNLISCNNKIGIDELMDVLIKNFKQISLTEEIEPLGLSERCQDIIKNDILFGMDEFENFVELEDVVLATESLKQSVEGIGKITGTAIGIEEVLDVVFSSFCIGK